MKLDKLRWIDVSPDVMSIETIRALHQPADAFRVSPDSKPPNYGAYPCSNGVASRIYVLDGILRVAVEPGDIGLTAATGDVLVLSKGEYWEEVLGDAPAQLVRVYELPHEFVDRVRRSKL